MQKWISGCLQHWDINLFCRNTRIQDSQCILWTYLRSCTYQCRSVECRAGFLRIHDIFCYQNHKRGNLVYLWHSTQLMVPEVFWPSDFDDLFSRGNGQCFIFGWIFFVMLEMLGLPQNTFSFKCKIPHKPRPPKVEVLQPLIFCKSNLFCKLESRKFTSCDHFYTFRVPFTKIIDTYIRYAPNFVWVS